MLVSIFHNITTTPDGRMAIYDRSGERRAERGDELQFMGILELPDGTSLPRTADLAWAAGNSPADTAAGDEYRSWKVRSLCVGDVIAIEEEDRRGFTATALDYRTIGAEVTRLWEFKLTGAVIVSMRIENAYENHEDVETAAVDVVIPAPPGDVNSAEYEEWSQTHIIERYTGTGHTDGDAWYDVEIIGSSDPALVGLKFDWGY